MEREDLRAEPRGRIIPVFVTAEVPTTVLEKLLEEDAIYQIRSSYRLHIVRSAEPEYVASVRERTLPPVEPFVSPFLGWDVGRLNDWFVDNIQPLTARGEGRWTYTCFYVVDEHSEATESVYLVTADQEKRTTTTAATAAAAAMTGATASSDSGPVGVDEGQPVGTDRAAWAFIRDEETDLEFLRCEFAAARQIATAVEVGNESLYEEHREIERIQTGLDVTMEL